MLPADVKPFWSEWHDATIRITSLPHSITPPQLATHFQLYGNVVFIRIHVERDRRPSATLRFSPPPYEACWGDSLRISIDGHQHQFQATLLRQRNPDPIQAPCTPCTVPDSPMSVSLKSRHTSSDSSTTLPRLAFTVLPEAVPSTLQLCSQTFLRGGPCGKPLSLQCEEISP